MQVIQETESTLEDFQLHADTVIVQMLYPLLRRAELEYEIDPQTACAYVGDKVLDLLALYMDNVSTKEA